MRKIGPFLLFLIVISAFGQNIDSLKLALKNAKHDTARCAILSVLVEITQESEWVSYNEQMYAIVKQRLASDKDHRKAYLKYLANALNNFGYLENLKGDIKLALSYYHQSLKLTEEIKDSLGIANSLTNIGDAYRRQKDFQKALEYLNNSLKIAERIRNETAIASNLNNMGVIYEAQGDLKNALNYYKLALIKAVESGNKEGQAQLYNNIGFIYSIQDSLPKALEYYKKSLSLREEIGDKRGIGMSLNNIGLVFLKNGNLREAYSYGNTCLRIAQELGYPDNIKNAAELLKKIFQKENRFKEAYRMFELEVIMRDSVLNEETQKAALKKQMQYAFEKKEAVAQKEHEKQLEKQKAIADEKQRKQTIVIWSVVIGLIVLIGFVAYVFKTLRVTRKQKLLIEVKSREVEEKQKEILDSIHYARRIQQALIPSEKYIYKNLSRLRKKG